MQYRVEKRKADSVTDQERKVQIVASVDACAPWLYFRTPASNSSIHGYYEGWHSSPSWRRGRIEVPTAVAVAPEFPLDCVVPRTWVERTYNLKRWTPMSQGGHFLAMEEPQRLVEDVRAFFRDMRP